MNYKIKTVSFVLLTSWWLTASAASQMIDFTVPLNISNLSEKVGWFFVSCELLQANGGIYSIESTRVTVDTNTGKPSQNQVQVRLSLDPGSSQPPTRWKCGLYFPNPGRALNTRPSANEDADMQPEPGTPLVEEVSGELPAPAPRIKQPPR